MKRYCFVLLTFLLGTLSVSAQKAERKHIREGNRSYQEEKFTEAEVAYRKALEVDRESPEANFNLGNALFRQEKPQEAVEQYRLALDDTDNHDRRAAAWHNVGNACMMGQDYASAVNAYRHSLILHPQDNETRYNLAMAQALLKQQEQQQQQQQDQQDQQQEQQEQQEQQQDQPQPQDRQERNDEQQDQQEQQQEQLSQEKAQELLDALMQDEQEVQDKVKKLQMQQGQRVKTEKDW